MNNGHVADDGYAFWVVPKNDQSGASNLDIHINLWIMPNKGEDKILAYTDFGIRTYNVKNVKEICCYIPFPIDDSDFEDISMRLKNDNVARGVFNTNCTINIDGKTGIIELKYNAHDSNLAELPQKIEPYCGGSLISFDVDKISDRLTKDELYIRFRVLNDKMVKLFGEKSGVVKTCTSALSSPIRREDYLYTIRINEMRVLPEQIRYRKEVQEQKVLKTILTLCVNGPYIVDTTTCYKTRVIEKKLFQGYIPNGFSMENCVVYQWLQEKEARAHYNLTCILRKEEIKKTSLFMYAVFVVFLSALGGGLVELLKIIIQALTAG